MRNQGRLNDIRARTAQKERIFDREVWEEQFDARGGDSSVIMGPTGFSGLTGHQD